MESQIQQSTLAEKSKEGTVILNVENLKSDKEFQQLPQLPQLPQSKNHKAFDAVSVSSSTHFTIINGGNGYSKNKRICRRGRHITVYCMTLLFFIGVIGLIFAFNARAKRNASI